MYFFNHTATASPTYSCVRLSAIAYGNSACVGSPPVLIPAHEVSRPTKHAILTCSAKQRQSQKRTEKREKLTKIARICLKIASAESCWHAVIISIWGKTPIKSQNSPNFSISVRLLGATPTPAPLCISSNSDKIDGWHDVTFASKFLLFCKTVCATHIDFARAVESWERVVESWLLTCKL